MRNFVSFDRMIQLGMLVAAVTGALLVQTASAQTCVNGGACNPSSLDNIVYVDGATYPQTIPGIQNAINSLPSSGGVIRALCGAGYKLQRCCADRSLYYHSFGGGNAPPLSDGGRSLQHLLLL